MGSYEKHFVLGEGGGGNKLIASEKLIKVYLLWPIRYRLNKYKVPMKKKRKKKNRKTRTDTHTHIPTFGGLWVPVPKPTLRGPPKIRSLLTSSIISW